MSRADDITSWAVMALVCLLFVYVWLKYTIARWRTDDQQNRNAMRAWEERHGLPPSFNLRESLEILLGIFFGMVPLLLLVIALFKLIIGLARLLISAFSLQPSTFPA